MIVKGRKKNRNRKIVFGLLAIAWIGLIGYAGFYIWKQATKQPTITTFTIDGVETKVDETPVKEEQKQEHTVPSNDPRYLTIPSLGIDRARIVQLGIIKKTNQLDAPVSIYDAGWYHGSARPGSGSGAVLIDGHNGGPNYGGIFEHLGRMKPGEIITVELGNGQKYNYKVADVREMEVQDINDANNPYGMSTMLDSIEPGKQGLNMISCVGDWIQDSQTFNKRVMLRAVQV